MSDTIHPLQGEWTIHQIAELREALRPVVAQGCSQFDGADVSEMDSSGLQVLLAARNTLASQGREIHLLHASRPMREVLSCYGLDENLIPLHPEALS